VSYSNPMHNMSVLPNAVYQRLYATDTHFPFAFFLALFSWSAFHFLSFHSSALHTSTNKHSFEWTIYVIGLLATVGVPLAAWMHIQASSEFGVPKSKLARAAKRE
jgi:hypothetical protein